jgi:low temperature requirement protein LtrA
MRTIGANLNGSRMAGVQREVADLFQPFGVAHKESNWMRDQSDRRGQAAGPVRASDPARPDAGVATRRERWARLRGSLWQPPRPHGEQPRERMVGPLELFYDLAVVVLVAQAAHHLAEYLTWRGLGEFAVVFTLVWIAWTNGSLYHELHGHEDARARSTFLLQILVLVAIGSFIPGAGGARGAAFAIATGVLFAVLAVLWLLAARGDRPEYRRPSRLFVTGTAACAVLLAGTALLPASARVAAWGVLDAAYLAGFAAVILKASPAPAAALVVTDALIERFGLLTIIVLGETLTGVVAGLAGQPISALTLSVGLVAVMVGFGAWWTYFDFAGHRHPRPEPMASVQWILGHLPLTAAVAAMGAAMVSLVDHAHDGHTPAATAWILSAGAAVVLGATMLISASLQAWHRDRGLYRPLARTCAAVAAVCLGVGAAQPTPLVLGLALVLLLSIPWGFAVAHRLANGADLPRGGRADRGCPSAQSRASPGTAA